MRRMRNPERSPSSANRGNTAQIEKRLATLGQCGLTSPEPHRQHCSLANPTAPIYGARGPLHASSASLSISLSLVSLEHAHSDTELIVADAIAPSIVPAYPHQSARDARERTTITIHHDVVRRGKREELTLSHNAAQLSLYISINTIEYERLSLSYTIIYYHPRSADPKK